jgi:hypothetical protein
MLLIEEPTMTEATANQSTTPPKETWRDWLPPGAPEPERVLTRAEVLEHLARWRVDATENDLRYWEYVGVLPRPVRRWHNGAVRATYPDWFPHLVRRVRAWQRLGASLDLIRPRVRAYARISLGLSDDPIDAEIRQARPTADGPEDLSIPPEIMPTLERLAAWHARLSGIDTERIEVRVVDVQGNWTSYPLLIAPTPAPQPTEIN